MSFSKKLKFTHYLSILILIILAMLDTNHIFIGMWNNIISFLLLGYVCFGFAKKNIELSS